MKNKVQARYKTKGNRGLRREAGAGYKTKVTGNPKGIHTGKTSEVSEKGSHP